ncbi:MAG: exopolysaccharide biosynthesis polyprenyl glycosylphosphotransferase [Brevundimonas sp.]|nr:MAG: exopolysaccharide biosynthesis polyprenyl glycosylphosphotransferase [Brevundimonas sp.]
MTDAASRMNFDGAPSDPAVLDASGLQALAASLSESPDAKGAARRGPFRPDVWLNARQRHASRLAAHYFRAFDVLAVVGMTTLCAWAVSPGPLIHTELSQAAPFALGAVTVLVLLRSLGLYRFARKDSTLVHLAAVAGVVLTGGVVALAVGGLLRGPGAQWTAYLVWTALVLVSLHVLHMAWSDVVSRWRKTGVLTPNIVLVGATRHAEGLIREALKRRDINVLGIFDDRLARNPRALEGVPVLGATDDLLTHKVTPYVDRVVLAIDPKAEARVREINARLRTLPNEITLLVEPNNAAETASALDRLAAAPLADIQGPIDGDRRAYNKRLQDLVLGLAATVALAPVMAAVALAIRLDSPGPIFFRQRRHGFNHEEIVVWKFRSMKQESADATASRQVTHDDDRVTRVGRFIRKTSLDELPQLLNVITGEMSLVGPRPHAIGMKTGHIESARLVAEYAHRHRIKPGMTGWAAVNGSRGPLHTAQDVRRRVQLDIDYVETQSLWLDLWIMAITVPVLLGDRAAIR